ncbi:MAG: flavodoxin family protein [Candidatus Altiarchaeota archaeon]|nr:flavodoxin family protein [Candidatus Altiarchaeota archaeon]
MRVVGVSGSHRRDANTRIMVERVLEACKKAGLETELITLADRKIGYCTNCDYCKTNYGCSIKDDVWSILTAMEKADAIVIGSPTYFGGISGRLRSLFDRTLPLRRNGMKLSAKIGAALATGGSRNGGQEYVISDIHRWMLIQEMTVVGDKTTAHFGGICNSRNPGDVLNDEIGLKTVDNTAQRIIETLKQKKASSSCSGPPKTSPSNHQGR